MNDPILAADSDPAAATTGGATDEISCLRAIADWLNVRHPAQPRDELEALRGHLLALREIAATNDERAALLERLFDRALPLINALTPSLLDHELPLPRSTGRTLRVMHELLWQLAADLPAASALGDAAHDGEAATAAIRSGGALWRSVDALARHLLLSYLTASPASSGVWLALHQRHVQAVRLGLAEHIPAAATRSLRQVYNAALLVACAHPAALTAREISFVAAFAERFAGQVDAPSAQAPAGSATFWIDPLRDQPPAPLARRAPPPDSGALFFSCAALATLVERHMTAAGDATIDTSLPVTAITPEQRGTLRHLLNCWGAPRKRRFLRRRQSSRAQLCAGLTAVIAALRGQDSAPLSDWMIINESPDGYAVMHVGGDSGPLAVGEVVAVRCSEDDSGKDRHWQIAMVRWAISENPEHLELGLQIVAPLALPALLALPASGTTQAALLLPAAPPLHERTKLLIAAAALPAVEEKLIVVVDSGRVDVRELHIAHTEELTPSLALFAVQADERV
ncbi:hypothetical protein [Rhodocyclus tenuis]|uniref:GTPase n=1 Tax=Rhodocyclus tenuis TaxID=1066 RepID=A0A840G4D3_RHOTE|nr:hypothetical protein [Rhodocyclus tenuis]MBB4246765.1 hypothetical protein [Rhodocyclus tenuis]